MSETAVSETSVEQLDAAPLLEVYDLYSGYRPGEDILHGVSLYVHAGEIVCVIGPNGAGKSTVFKALYGFLPVRHGRVLFDDRDITNIRPQEALRSAGITIVPQLRSVFPEMTVEENLRLGMYLVRDKRRIQRRLADVLDLFPRLAERSRQMVGTMSGGEQRMVEIGRALMWEPKMVLMDEPSAGLAPIITKSIFAKIDQLNREIGLTVLMIEQNARQGLEISDRGYVLEMGRPTYEGASDELLASSEVRRAFLGG
jgi:ABC-type branched-subunit amino acid transport system ATPase component